MITLGISALYHDSAATLIKDGEIIAAAHEERFTRIKHDKNIPYNAINYCLERANIFLDEVDKVIFHENPLKKIERWRKNLHDNEEYDNEAYLQNKWKHDLETKIDVPSKLRKEFGTIGRTDRLYYTDHHYSHAASAFYPSPFEEAAIMVVDGVGELDTLSIGWGSGNVINLDTSVVYPNSIGLLYSAFTYYCGFKVNSGEYKLMGLAPYGEPIYSELIRKNIINVEDSGVFDLNLNYFSFAYSEIPINSTFIELFGNDPRSPEDEISKFYMDVAASLQLVLEEILIKLARSVKDRYKTNNLVLAGGVALNCSANGKLSLEKIFDNIWIQPAAGDAGCSLGAAYIAQYFDNAERRKPSSSDSMKGSYLGPSFTNDYIGEYLELKNYPSKRYEENEIQEKIAQYLSEGLIVGHFYGKAEFGPRALGHRSILGDPRSIEMQTKMNLKIKFRESFRPFAPSMLVEDRYKYFKGHEISPYMLLVMPLKDEYRFPVNEELLNKNGFNMLPYLKQKRSALPAITHVDYTGRIQTVNNETCPRYFGIISRFKKITGYGVVVNTSFNVRGEPIVNTPEEAYHCFMSTNMDVLVLENFILIKTDQPKDKMWNLKTEND